MAEEKQREKLPENYIPVSGQSVEVKRRNQTRMEYAVADEKYLMAVSKVLKKFETAVLSGRGKATGRCIRLATHQQLKGTIDEEKSFKSLKIGSEEVERENKRSKEQYTTYVEFVEITLYRKG